MALLLVMVVAVLLALFAAASLLKTEAAPVRVRVDDVERQRRRR